MKKLIISFAFIALTANAEKPFEINRKNCNLPIGEISKRFPQVDKRQIQLACAKKASHGNWLKRTLTKK